VISEGLNEGYLVYFDNRQNSTPILDEPYFEQNDKRVYVFQAPIMGRRSAKMWSTHEHIQPTPPAKAPF
jgi:hypothetical protein